MLNYQETSPFQPGSILYNHDRIAVTTALATCTANGDWQVNLTSATTGPAVFHGDHMPNLGGIHIAAPDHEPAAVLVGETVTTIIRWLLHATRQHQLRLLEWLTFPPEAYGDDPDMGLFFTGGVAVLGAPDFVPEHGTVYADDRPIGLIAANTWNPAR